MAVRTWKKCFSISRATGGGQREPGSFAPHLGADVPAPRALPQFVAASAGTGLLASFADVHLGVYRTIPDGADGHFRSTCRGDAVGGSAAVGGRAAQPDGCRAQLPGGDVVPQSGAHLRQSDASLGAGLRHDRHVDDPHAGRYHPCDWRRLAALRVQPVLAGAHPSAVLHEPDDHGVGRGAWRGLADPAPWGGRRSIGVVGAIRPDTVFRGILPGFGPSARHSTCRTGASIRPCLRRYACNRPERCRPVGPFGSGLRTECGVAGYGGRAVRPPVSPGPAARRVDQYWRMMFWSDWTHA